MKRRAHEQREKAVALADAFVRAHLTVPIERATATQENEALWVVAYRVVPPDGGVIDTSHLFVEVDLLRGTARFFPVM